MVDLVTKDEEGAEALRAFGYEATGIPKRVRFFYQGSHIGMPIRADHFDTMVYTMANDLNQATTLEKVVDVLNTFNFSF